MGLVKHCSVGGVFVIAELRSSGYKNARLFYIQEHLILRGVTYLWEDKVVLRISFLVSVTDLLLINC
jgi:hypothetical protein